jgi:hypothetical protein
MPQTEHNPEIAGRANRMLGAATAWLNENGLQSRFAPHLLPQTTESLTQAGVTAGHVESFLSTAINTTVGPLKNKPKLSGDSMGYIVGEAIIGLSQYEAQSNNTREFELEERLVADPLNVLKKLKEGVIYRTARFNEEYIQDFYQSLISRLLHSKNEKALVSGFRLLSEQAITLKTADQIFDSYDLRTLDTLSQESLDVVVHYLQAVDSKITSEVTKKYADTVPPSDWDYNDEDVFIEAKKLFTRALLARGDFDAAIQFADETDNTYPTHRSLSLTGDVREYVLTHEQPDKLASRINTYQSEYIPRDHSTRENSFIASQEGKIMSAVHALEARADVQEPEILGLYDGLVKSLDLWQHPLVEQWSRTLFSNPDGLRLALMAQKKVAQMDVFVRRADKESGMDYLRQLLSIVTQLAVDGYIPFNGTFIEKLSVLGVDNRKLQEVVETRIAQLLPDDAAEAQDISDQDINLAEELLDCDQTMRLYTIYCRGDEMSELRSAFENPSYLNLLDRIAKSVSLPKTKRRWFEGGGGF